MFPEKKEKQRVLERNVIGTNTSILGDVISEGDFRIDGKVEGTIKTGGRVVIGKTGIAIGKIYCTDADIEGNFSGELQVENILTLKSSATISGEVTIGKLSIEPGAAFNATCIMKNAVKELKNGQSKKEKPAS
ncbi:polymer-forming cytoskeletal protein [Lutibacter sp. HS1-25]|uniref:bactofilin family protein n=1 Tax=Lutibacter sp. HS1-25 TaxID=2485000 RepID=UPI001011C911|nr:polymer-forming cytoskeletal protein [Lutibacter sp. HS1-25]RXP49333.1 polymer-forming cytoskeletal protein [Lutibacter sp. HS1-25]